MSDTKFPIFLTLKSDHGGASFKGQINSETDSFTFKAVPPGQYTLSGLSADRITQVEQRREDFRLRTNITYIWNDSGLSSSRPSHFQASPQPSRRRPPVKAIIGFSLAAVLGGHLGGGAPLVRASLRSAPNSQPTESPTIQRSPISKGYEKTFSSSIENQLKTCVKNNAIYLSEIPTLSRFLKSISWEIDAEDEFEQQLITLYADYEQIRIAIDRCNPLLAYEVVAARVQATELEENRIEYMSAENAVLNVRESSTEYSRILEQLPYGTPVVIDRLTTSSLSENDKQKIRQREGWQPIILPNGKTGYVFNRYIRSSL